MTLKERIQWIARTALILFILASVTFLSALVAIRYAIRGREVVVPDLVGKSQKVAQQQLDGLNIGLRVENRVFSPLPVDAIVRQSPPPDTHVKSGSNEHIVLSLGPQKVTVPALQGMTERAARIELLRNSMQLGEESIVYLPGGPESTVIDQDPPPGTPNATSPQENLLVSAATPPGAYVMPELVGSTVASAQVRLAAAGLKISKISPAQSPGAPHGTVLDQSPARGQRIDGTISIELQIAE